MNIRFLNLMIIFLFLCSCSTLSKNMTKEGIFSINGGRALDQGWDESLIFRRISWYVELNIVFDLMVGKVSKNSKFYNWFSDSDKQIINNCSELYMLITYSSDSANSSSKSELLHQLENNQIKLVRLRSFTDNFHMHPSARINFLDKYSVDGICLTQGQVTKLKSSKVSFPGFNQVSLLN
jgi:hypothetical protein